MADRRVIGVDESGKGDFFGPLVVAALLVPDGDIPVLERLGVRDGKKLSDNRVEVICDDLCELYPHRIEVVSPAIYNITWDKTRNLNRLLAAVHARAIDGVMTEHGADVAIIDQFGKTELVAEALAARKQGIALEQRFRGEEILQVAGASIIARATFIRELKRLSDEFAVDLPKGAAPQVDRAGRRFVKIHGADKLIEVAKVHFKNFHRVVNPGLFAG
jgi:ribonuclease HIII